MLDFVQKRKLRTLMYHRTTLIVLGCVVLLLARSVWGVYQKKRDSEALREKTAAEVAVLSSHLSSISHSIDWIETPQGEEEEIRNKYNVVKPDEHMVVIVSDASSTASTTQTSSSIWASFIGLFKPHRR